MPPRLVQIQHNTRNRRIFQPHKSTSVGFSNTLFLIITQKFEQFPTSCRNKSDKGMFKQKLKLFLCPKRYKFLSRGTKMGCKLPTQIRVGRSYHNFHGFKVGKSLTPYCNCNNSSIDSPSHYFLDYSLHADEQQTLFNTFEQYIPKFNSFSKKTKLETILCGYDIGNNDIFTTNVSLQLTTQKYILQTKRFD